MKRLTREEVKLLESLIKEKIEYIIKEIDLLDGSGENFFINDGLINEVRISKENYKKELKKYRELLNKLNLS